MLASNRNFPNGKETDTNNERTEESKLKCERVCKGMTIVAEGGRDGGEK